MQHIVGCNKKNTKSLLWIPALEEAQLESNPKETLDKLKLTDILQVNLKNCQSHESEFKKKRLRNCSLSKGDYRDKIAKYNMSLD